MIRLEQIEENRPRKDQDAGGQQNDLRVQGEPPPVPPEPGDHLLLDDEADPAEDDEPHDGQVDNPVPAIRHQIVRKERVAAVVEGRHGVVEGVIEGRRRREILQKANEQKDRPHGLADEGEPQNPLDDHDKVAPRRMEKGGLDDLPPLEGDPPPHQAEEDDGEGDDPQAPDLEEDERHELAGERQILSDIDDGKARHADRGGGGEEGVHKAQVAPTRSKGKPEEERPDQDRQGETEDEDPRRRQVLRDRCSDA